ncbi:TlpA family protein disulfide reductase [Lysobacter sp. KIS68-7]|uniref:TlpA disulfide reductase family protein n=1 Tax=Lysobacter sp. KIS68-7 TaxID=2904252 RepID=UPI001E5817EE|nr:TlpA disulfide reductase family protein [Lysobacter sp. KIS68-7]UHQ20786.1 TlpA family protein disulfide reductase [Lysobacter sp. KIS68-7]
MTSGTKVVLVALLAGALGVVASLMTSGPGPLLRTELGQRALGTAMEASAPPPPPGLEVAKRGERVPNFTLPDLQGQQTHLPGAYAGRPVLINLWASWCGPCVTEMPALQSFAGEQGSNGVQVVGIALDDPQAVRAFIARTGVAYPILIDAAGPADAGVRLGNPKGVLPYSVLISADGRLLKQRIGPFEEGEIAAWARN